MHENRETSSLAASNTGSPVGEGPVRNPNTNGDEESDGVVIPVKQPNKATEQQAEAAEAVGKDANQEEHQPGTHGSGTGRKNRVPGLGGCAQSGLSRRSVLTPDIRGRSRMR